MFSLFADQEREAKLDSLDYPLASLETHVDFAALATEINRWAPRSSHAKDGRPPCSTALMARLLVLHLLNLSMRKWSTSRGSSDKETRQIVFRRQAVGQRGSQAQSDPPREGDQCQRRHLVDLLGRSNSSRNLLNKELDWACSNASSDCP